MNGLRLFHCAHKAARYLGAELTLLFTSAAGTETGSQQTIFPRLTTNTRVYVAYSLRGTCGTAVLLTTHSGGGSPFNLAATPTPPTSAFSDALV